MKRIFIESTRQTPYIELDPNGHLKIKGRSIHENPAIFFDPLVNWIKEYIKKPQETTIFDIELEYFNSGSSRYILMILQTLSEIEKTNKILVNWYYEDGDDDLLERGQYFSSLLSLNFNFIEIQ
jgi:hypothetical protein